MSEEFIEDIITETENKSAENKSADEEKSEENQAEKPSETVVEKPDEKPDEDPNEKPVEKDTKSETDKKIEELAIQIGWNPNYKADDAVDAATYILKSREIQDTMKSNINDFKRQTSTLQSSISALKEHNEKVFKAELKRKEAEIAQLKKEKLAAVELADVKKVTEIDSQIEDIQKDINTTKPADTPSDNPVFNEWIKDNQWYLLDDEMALYAETVAQQYPGAPPERVYKKVREKVEELFPEKFEKAASTTTTVTNDPAKEVPKKEKAVGPASPVEAPTKVVTTPKFTKADLSHDQMNVMKQFVSAGIMTEEQYINDIAKLQEA